jgi:hypothetical protein
MSVPGTGTGHCAWEDFGLAWKGEPEFLEHVVAKEAHFSVPPHKHVPVHIYVFL